jgi:hypothetical protein
MKSPLINRGLFVLCTRNVGKNLGGGGLSFGQIINRYAKQD